MFLQVTYLLFLLSKRLSRSFISAGAIRYNKLIFLFLLDIFPSTKFVTNPTPMPYLLPSIYTPAIKLVASSPNQTPLLSNLQIPKTFESSSVTTRFPTSSRSRESEC
jgi:hypothetical protein